MIEPVLPPVGELALVVALTLLPCAVLAVAVAVRRPAARSLRGAVLAAAGISAAVMTVAIAAVGQTMFLSAHDLGLLAAVLTVSAAVGTAVALRLARRLSHEAERLVTAAAAVGGDGPVWRGPLPRTGELAAIAVQLQRTADELRRARQAQSLAEQGRQELVTWMSHDLRTPLAGIRAMAEALEDGVVGEPADVQRYHRQMRLDAERLAAMVDDLFELSRLSSGAGAQAATELDLRAVAGDVVNGCRVLDPGRALQLDLPDAPVRVQAAAQDLARALRNVVVNALLYSPADAPVDVVVRCSDGSGVVDVVDRCGGIPPADLERLFDVGFRGSPARTPDARAGAGLGLAISRRLLQEHAGDLTVHSSAGGCRMRLTLPARRPRPPVPLPQPATSDA